MAGHYNSDHFSRSEIFNLEDWEWRLGPELPDAFSSSQTIQVSFWQSG